MALLTYACVDCGQVVTRKRRPEQAKVCFKCAKQHCIDQMDRAHAESERARQRNREQQWQLLDTLSTIP